MSRCVLRRTGKFNSKRKSFFPRLYVKQTHTGARVHTQRLHVCVSHRQTELEEMHSWSNARFGRIKCARTPISIRIPLFSHSLGALVASSAPRCVQQDNPIFLRLWARVKRGRRLAERASKWHGIDTSCAAIQFSRAAAAAANIVH